MPRFKLTVEYDGTDYLGWQRQDEGRTIQTALEEAVAKLMGLTASPEVVGSGRTDSGVHALGQVAHVDIDRDLDGYRIMQGINFHLSEPDPTIAVVTAEQVDAEFNARFHATKRHYLYRIINRKPRPAIDLNRVWHVPETLDVNKMHEAAQQLIGHYDFTSFRDSQCQAKNPEKTLDDISVEQVGQEVHIRVSARSFLHHQVRNFAGTLWQVGTGRIEIADVKTILEAKDRTKAGQTIAPDGLYLTKVHY